jgi:hypothetical protein
MGRSRLSTAIDADKTAGARLNFRDVPPHARLIRDLLACVKRNLEPARLTPWFLPIELPAARR